MAESEPNAFRVSLCTNNPLFAAYGFSELWCQSDLGKDLFYLPSTPTLHEILWLDYPPTSPVVCTQEEIFKKSPNKQREGQPTVPFHAQHPAGILDYDRLGI